MQRGGSWRALWVLGLAGCEGCEPWPEGPTVRIDSPAQDQFVGTSIAECFEVAVSGHLYNVDRLADFELYVQGKKVPRYEIRATSTPGYWSFSTLVDLFPTNELGMGSPDATFAAEYPRYPWLASRAAGWENRVRPFLAELVRPADRADLSAFVSRDLHTAIDARRSNCQSWDAAWTQDAAEDVVSTTLTPDGLVAISPVVQSKIPHPDLPTPQSDIDVQIGAGVLGPTASESCALYGDFGAPDATWTATWATLVAAAEVANAAAASVSLPPPYPSPTSRGNWEVCARWTSTFDYLGWMPPDGLVVDPRPESSGVPRLGATWQHLDAPFQLIVQAEDAVIRWAGLAPSLEGPVAVDACPTAGVADISFDASFGFGTDAEPEALDVRQDGLDASAVSVATAIPEPCNTGTWRETVRSLMASADGQIAGLYQGALAQGGVYAHPALAMRDALHGAVPGRWTSETHGAIVTDPTATYEGGEPGVCDAASTGLTLSHVLEASPGALGWEGGWLLWGGRVQDERDPLSGVGSIGDPTTCDETDFVDGDWVMAGPPQTAALMFTTAYANAVMAQAVNADLDGSFTLASDATFVGRVADELGLSATRSDLTVTLDAMQSSFVSPEWHPQVGHWVATVRRTSDDALLTEAIFNLWALTGWDLVLGGGVLDDHVTVGGSAYAIEGVAVAGTLRPTSGELLAAFGPRLQSDLATHVAGAADEVGRPEWFTIDGGPWFANGVDAPARWQDNRALTPYDLTP